MERMCPAYITACEHTYACRLLGAPVSWVRMGPVLPRGCVLCMQYAHLCFVQAFKIVVATAACINNRVSRLNEDGDAVTDFSEVLRNISVETQKMIRVSAPHTQSGVLDASLADAHETQSTV